MRSKAACTFDNGYRAPSTPSLLAPQALLTRMQNANKTYFLSFFSGRIRFPTMCGREMLHTMHKTKLNTIFTNVSLATFG